MQNDSQQESILKEINKIQHKLDDIFFRLDNVELSDQDLKFTYMYLELTSDMLEMIK